LGLYAEHGLHEEGATIDDGGKVDEEIAAQKQASDDCTNMLVIIAPFQQLCRGCALVAIIDRYKDEGQNAKADNSGQFPPGDKLRGLLA